MSKPIPGELVARAERGEARAQYQLAAALAGAGRPEEAERWLEKSAAGGEAEAFFTLGTRRLATKAGIPAAIALFEKAVGSGSASAARMLAGVFAAGYGREPELARAAFLLVAAARAGDPEAMRDVASALLLKDVDDADGAALVSMAAAKEPVAGAVYVRRACEGRAPADAAQEHLKRLASIHYPGTERLQAMLARAPSVRPPAPPAALDWARIEAALQEPERPEFVRVKISDAPAAYVVRGAVPPETIEHLIAVSARGLRPSMTFDPQTGQSRLDDYRKSMTATLGPADNDFALVLLNRRLAAIADIPPEHGEFLSVLKYAPGDEYRPHFDWIPTAGRDFEMSGQRVATALLYLNTEYEGGETHLMTPDIRFKGGPGDVLVFSNVTDDGAPDKSSRHASLPIRAGTKWLASKWFRAREHDF